MFHLGKWWYLVYFFGVYIYRPKKERKTTHNSL